MKNSLIWLGIAGLSAYYLYKKTTFSGEIPGIIQSVPVLATPTSSSAAAQVVTKAVKSGQVKVSSSLPTNWTSHTATTKQNITSVLSPPGSKNLFSDAVLAQINREIN